MDARRGDDNQATMDLDAMPWCQGGVRRRKKLKMEINNSRAKFTKFGVWGDAPTICFTNVLLIGITMPLIKIQTKYFKNPKEMLC